MEDFIYLCFLILIVKYYMKDLLTPDLLYTNFQDVRALTRNVIKTFPEKDLFEFSIANLRPFSAMVEEFVMLVDGVFGEILKDKHQKIIENTFPNNKSEILSIWDKTSKIINEEWREITDYSQELTLYQNTFSFTQWILYLIENETHHRGQGYTYLRALHIEPPLFWDRESFKK